MHPLGTTALRIPETAKIKDIIWRGRSPTPAVFGVRKEERIEIVRNLALSLLASSARHHGQHLGPASLQRARINHHRSSVRNAGNR